MAVILAVAGVAAAVDAPIPIDGLDQRARARLHTVRLRIEPTVDTDPALCRSLDSSGLDVRLGGERIAPAWIRLERERQPAAHALLLDASHSMVGRMDYVRDAATAYVDRLRPDLERALVATFDESVVLVQGMTGDRVRLADAIQRVRMGGWTSLYDGLYYTMHELRTHPERPVIVLLTDGIDTASLHDQDDVRRLVDSRPDLTIFVVALPLPPGVWPGDHPFLKRLTRRTHGRFFDVPTSGGLEDIFLRIREILDSEATLTFVDPDPEAEPGRVRVSSKLAGCKVKIIDPRDAEPPASDRLPLDTTTADLPQVLPYPPGPDYRELDDQPFVEWFNRCGDEVDPAALKTANWYVEAGADRLHGCGLDITMERGALKLTSRPFEIRLPRLDDLPDRPEQALDALARFALTTRDSDVKRDARKRPEDAHARPYDDYSGLVHGRVLLESREALARSLFLYEEYRDWVMQRLHDEAGQMLDALRDKLRLHAGELPAADLETILLSTDEAQEILRRAGTPSGIDVQRYLTAWLGDISAHDLFVRWEIERLNLMLSDPDDAGSLDAFHEEWTALRKVFFVPSYARMLTLLSPVYDRRRERVGFYRVILPRPSWFGPRLKGWKKHPEFVDLPLDLVPTLPLGYWALALALADDASVAATLRDGAYRVTGLRYELLDKARHQAPRKAFRHTRVTIELQSTSAATSPPPELVLSAEIDLDHGHPPPILEQLEISKR